jgi:hypothetical protein
VITRTHVCSVPGCPQLAPCPTHARDTTGGYSERDKRAQAFFRKAVMDPVTGQWSPGDHALALELGANYYAIKPELRFKMQTALGLNASGRRSLRWRNAAETDSAAKADAHAREVRRLRIVADQPEE